MLQIVKNFPEFQRFLSEFKLYFTDKPPKGFEKFFPKSKNSASEAEAGGKNGGQKTSEKKLGGPDQGATSSSTAAGPKNAGAPKPTVDPWSSIFGGGGPKGGGTGGGKSAGGGVGGEGGDKIMVLAVAGTLGILGVFAYYEMNYKEITWKEFVNK